jgi:hypothetical protein
MIDPKELRIGNMVYVNEFPCKMVKAYSWVPGRITQITAKSALADHAVSNKECEPIPLSIVSVGQFKWEKEDGWRMGDNEVDLFETGPISVSLPAYGDVIVTAYGAQLPHMKFIHQLQNLVFVLTGNELRELEEDEK